MKNPEATAASENATTPGDNTTAGELTRRPWVTPEFERVSLKDALGPARSKRVDGSSSGS